MLVEFQSKFKVFATKISDGSISEYKLRSSPKAETGGDSFNLQVALKDERISELEAELLKSKEREKLLLKELGREL